MEDEGARLENIVANAIKKELHFIEDTEGLKSGLYYLRTKDGKELDFLVSIERKPTHLIEVKMKNGTPSRGFYHFVKLFPDAICLQLVKNLSRNKSFPEKIFIKNLIPWLSNFSFLKNSKIEF